MSVTRRQFLAGLGGLLATRGLASARPAPPRYVVQILLAGGFDPILTVDPKDQSAVAATIDCGYAADARLRGVERLYGPLMGAMMRHEAALSLVHGVRVDTTSHADASRSVLHGRVDVTPSTPLFGDALGRVLPGSAPIAHLALVSGNSFGQIGVSSALHRPDVVYLHPSVVSVLFDPRTDAQTRRLLFRQRPAWAADAAAGRIAAASDVFAGRAAASAAYAETSRNADALGRLLAGVDEVEGISNSQLGAGLKVAAHAIRGNHARCLVVESDYFWFDSHTDNLHVQRQRIPPAFADIAAFIDLLAREHNEHGPLLDQTTIAIGSEIGRYPKLNANDGKDHWPESSWLLLGRGVRRGVTIGATDARYRGVAVDHRTGLAGGAGARPIFLDAIFASIAAAAGADPAQLGYAADAPLRTLVTG